ncbi:hypothetical protein [Clostridium sp.]|uniref:hypothetical protein n=1 Tax=Clostridium sp. TaxID=1506 RepID=UPI0025C01D91|nr:hypothetical protein [Clostridium sp.]
MKNYYELKNYQVQLLNLKEEVLEDNPELKEELQTVTNSLKQYKQEKKYERPYTKEELREQISSIRNIEYLIEQQQNKLFAITDSNKVQDSFYKTNITIIGLNIRRLKEYKKELKNKIKNNQIFFTDQKKISNNWRFKQC